MPDPEINDIDRMAYIDGQLDDLRCLHVETVLSEDPPAAAEMMGDLAQRSALRVSLTQASPLPSPQLQALAARALAPNAATAPAAPRPSPWRAARLTAIAAALGTAALLGFTDDAWRVQYKLPGNPEYLDDAAQSRQASLVRTSMASRPTTPWMKPHDIATAIRIRLPDLPHGWHLTDVQVYPSDEGPSAQLLIDTGDGRQVSLFSSRIRHSTSAAPMVVDRFGETMAFWELEGQSFVLIGDIPRTELHDMAIDLADNRLL